MSAGGDVRLTPLTVVFARQTVQCSDLLRLHGMDPSAAKRLTLPGLPYAM